MRIIQLKDEMLNGVVGGGGPVDATVIVFRPTSLPGTTGAEAHQPLSVTIDVDVPGASAGSPLLNVDVDKFILIGR